MPSSKPLPLRIHVLRQLNPFISCLLRSPLHSVASKRLLVLSYRGRKTGKEYYIPLAYVIHAGRVHCATRDTLWWKSAVDAPEVTLWLRGQPLRAKAARAETNAADTRGAFIQFLRENPGTATLLYQVPIDNNGEPNPSAVDEQLPQSQVIRFTPLTSD